MELVLQVKVLQRTADLVIKSFIQEERKMFSNKKVLLMTYTNVLKVILILILSLAYSFPAFANFVKAKKDRVEIYKKASKKSTVLGYFCKINAKKKNKDCLNEKNILETSSKREGLYWKVLLKADQRGYVSILKVKKTKAKSGSSTFSNILREAVQKKMSDTVSNSRQRSTVMGVRGLDENKKISSAGHVSPNLRLVNNMEKIVIKQSDLEELEEKIHKELEKSDQ